LETMDVADMAPNEPITHAYAMACADLRTAVINWKNIGAQDVAAFNAIATRSNVKPVAAPMPALMAPVCPAAGAGN
jgi:hypothetical protein